MEVGVRTGQLDKEPVDAIILLLYEGDSTPQGVAATLDKALDGAITTLLQD
jgi:hypothetical protein